MDTLTIGIVSVALLYWIITPSSSKNLNSLRQVKNTREKNPYPEDCWSGSSYVLLPHGLVHYYLLGNPKGKKLVFIHGISIPAIGTKRFIDGLVAKGHYVLVYDLYGRGYSDSPGIKHDNALYINQLLGLLTHLKWTDGSVDIIGISMGGAIVINFVRLFPYLVDKVVLIAPAGLLKTMPLSGYILLIPIIGEFLIYTLGNYLLIDNAKSQFTEDMRADQLKAFEFFKYQVYHHEGFRRTFLSCIRNFSLFGLDNEYAQVGQLKQEKVLLIWGTEDNVVNFQSCQKEIESYMAKAKLNLYPGLNHALVSQEPDRIAHDVHEFLD